MDRDVARGLVVSRPVFSELEARAGDTRGAPAAGEVCRLHVQPRSSGKPAAGRTAQHVGYAGGVSRSVDVGLSIALHAAALHGAGVGCADAVPVFFGSSG